MFKKVLIAAVLISLTMGAPAPAPGPKPQFVVSSPLSAYSTYSAYSSPYVLPEYVASPYASVYSGLGKFFWFYFKWFLLLINLVLIVN